MNNTLDLFLCTYGKDRYMKRIISLDFFRGFAIMAMMFVHVLIHIFSATDPANFSDTMSNPGLMAIFVPVFIFSNFRGFFLMISMVIHSYIISKNLQKGA